MNRSFSALSGDETATLLKKMKDQMAALTAIVEEMQCNQVRDSDLTTQGEEEDDGTRPGNLVTLMEST